MLALALKHCANDFTKRPIVNLVPIPKKSGGQRILSVPTGADRVAQMVVDVQ